MKTIYDKPDIQVNQSIFFRALGTTYKVLSTSVSGSALLLGRCPTGHLVNCISESGTENK